MTDHDAYIDFATQVLSRQKKMMPRAEFLRLGDEAAERLSSLPGSPALTEEAFLQELDRLLLEQLKVLPVSDWIRARKASQESS